jgi:hypothetical protein
MGVDRIRSRLVARPLTSGLLDIRDLGLLRLFEFFSGLMALTHR